MKDYALNHKEPLSAQKPKKVVFIEMFRAGPQISSTGQELVFTENDLDQVIGSYDPGHHEAPLIIGHDQQDDTPALGWVRKMWRKGKELWGKVELTPKAEQLIKDGVFKKVSSSFYLPEAETNPTPGKLSLRHLGLVSIPAVKGLTAFSEEIEQSTVTITPKKGESSISFKEPLGTNHTMARKKTKPETLALATSVVEHAEGGGMTVNINIGGGDKAKANVYDDNGNQISETGAPADYDMDYGMETEMEPEVPDMSMADDLGLEEDSDDESDPSTPPPDEDMATDPTASPEEPSEEEGEDEPSMEMETEDVSGDMEDGDQKIAKLASEYEIDELIKALALKTDAASMMEEKGMSYGEMPEGLKKAMEAKKEKGSKKVSKEKKDEYEEHEDMGEEVKGAGDPSCEEVKSAPVYAEKEEDEEEDKEDMGEGCKSYEEDEDEEKDKEDMGEGCKSYEEDEDDDKKKKSKGALKEATRTLDHSEDAMGVRGQKNLQARVAELEDELARQKKLMREKEISDFCEVLYGEGKLTQQIVSKTDLVRFMETLNNKNSVNFSGAGKASQFDFFKGILGSLPSMVSFEEFATPTSAPKSRKQPTPLVDGYVYDPSTADLHAQTLEYAEQKGVEYTVALKAVLSNS